MRTQTLLAFEQAAVDAQQAATAAKIAAKAEAKRREELDKMSPRLAREAAYRAKHPPGALCRIVSNTV